jgi:hypothetical protein
MHHEGGAGKAALPISRRAVDRSQDRGRQGRVRASCDTNPVLDRFLQSTPTANSTTSSPRCTSPRIVITVARSSVRSSMIRMRINMRPAPAQGRLDITETGEI